MHDPVLQFDQFSLQPEQFPEIGTAVEVILGPILAQLPQGGLETMVVELQFDLFVEVVEHLVLETFGQRFRIDRLRIDQLRIGRLWTGPAVDRSAVDRSSWNPSHFAPSLTAPAGRSSEKWACGILVRGRDARKTRRNN